MNKLDIREFRKKYNLSQEDLAEITGVRLRTVKAWEYGERNISNIAEKIIHNYTLRGVAKDMILDKRESKYLDNIKNKTHGDQMEMLYTEILELKKDNEELKDMVDDLTLKIEISLAPILRHFKLKVDTKEKQKDSSPN